MLAVYLFNLMGYAVFFQYFINLSDQQISQQADNNPYPDSALSEIKVELNLPYTNDWSTYERYNGEIEVNGVHYNYVKRKVVEGTLYLLCLPNQAKTQLCKQKMAYASGENDMSSGKENNLSAPKNFFLMEFKQPPFFCDFSISGLMLSGKYFYIPDVARDIHMNLIDHPPELNV